MLFRLNGLSTSPHNENLFPIYRLCYSCLLLSYFLLTMHSLFRSSRETDVKILDDHL